MVFIFVMDDRDGEINEQRRRVRRPTYKDLGRLTRTEMRQRLEQRGMVNLSRASLETIRAQYARVFGEPHQ